jgi:hypothetical protein
MAKKKAKKDLKKKKTKKKDKKKKLLKKKVLKKKDNKRKDSKKKARNKKAQAFDKPEKKSRTQPGSRVRFSDHSSNYNVRNAISLLRSLSDPEDVKIFTNGETRVSITKAITPVLNRLEKQGKE